MSNHVFRSLHQGPALLLLPNAWDAVTARLIESLGAKAIATTSAGLAWSRGYPDGNALPDDQLIAATCDIARVTRVPLTVDIEAGYSDDPRGVARLVARVVAAGAVGINIEDGAGSPICCARNWRPSARPSRIWMWTSLSTRAPMFIYATSPQGQRPSRKSSTGPRATTQPVATDCLSRAL